MHARRTLSAAPTQDIDLTSRARDTVAQPLSWGLRLLGVIGVVYAFACAAAAVFGALYLLLLVLEAGA